MAVTFAAAAAASPVFLTPHTTTGLGSTPLNFGGQTFINQGLVGAGRLTSGGLDFNGETLGSFSGMAVVPGSWSRSGNTYSGTIFTLPDRGYNNGNVFSDYAARLQTFDIAFTPYTGAANLPASPASQNQLVFNYKGGILLKDFNGNPTTGTNPGAGTIVQNGHTLPSPKAGQLGAGKISIDAEAVSLKTDGSFYVGDEYSSGVYYFNKSGQMKGFIDPVPALLPTAGGATNFGVDLNTAGRRTNQGMEGVSITPDQKKLVAVLQSATLQDSAPSGQQNRKNTRVLVYDISNDPTPTKPIGHYVLELPIVDDNGGTPAANRTGAQSEVLALNDHQFIYLTRDGNGLGVDNGNTLVFKSIYLADISGATNLAGTIYETTTTKLPVTSGVTIDTAKVTSLTNAELVNMLNSDQLAHLGLSIGVVNGHPQTSTNLLSEKWESFGLVSALDPNALHDFFLFVGNDNDFGTLSGMMSQLSKSDGTPSGSGAFNAGVINDNMVLVYRLTLPGASVPVPEPAGLSLFCVGLAGLAATRRRKAKNK